MDDASPVMQLLRAHVPLTLLLDLAWSPSEAVLLSREQADLARMLPRQDGPVRRAVHA